METSLKEKEEEARKVTAEKKGGLADNASLREEINFIRWSSEPSYSS